MIDGELNQVVATIRGGSSGIGINDKTNRIYVTDSINNVSVIDGETNAIVNSIRTGDEPKGIGVNPITNRIYIANKGSKTVSVIDGEIDVVIENIWIRP